MSKTDKSYLWTLAWYHPTSEQPVNALAGSRRI